MGLPSFVALPEMIAVEQAKISNDNKIIVAIIK
jgi:hypothetical protein